MSRLQQAQGAHACAILGVGAARGSRVVSNQEMCGWIDSTDEWITQRTGIASRRWVAEGETPLSLGTAAAREALQRSGVQPGHIDGVVVATVSHGRPTPSLACMIAAELELDSPAAFDLSAACAGFSYGLSLADSMVRTGSARNVLVIGVEVLSQFLDLQDRSTAFLLGDGAGAVVIGASSSPGIGPVVWGSKPTDHEVITIDDWADTPRESDGVFFHMEGREVFKWATTAVAQYAAQAIAVAGLQPEDLDCFIPHQANNRITDAMLRQLKLPSDVVVARDVMSMGNSSSASIPLAMHALLESGQAESGQIALIIGFGAGLVFSGQTLILP